MNFLLKIFLTIFFLAISLQANKKNGKHITAHGNVHALFLFIQFDDDSTTSSTSWPYDTLSLPQWCNEFIDSTDLPSGKLNLTQYFSEMSGGKFLLTGDVYQNLIRPKHDQSHYKNIGEVNYEILTSLDSLINFAKYDNWTASKSSQFVDTADGIVDMVYLIYRDFQNKLFYNSGWSGSAELYLNKDIKTNDGVVIKRGRMLSGTQMRGGKHGFHYSKYVAAHELGHFIFGAGHIEGVTNLALMAGGPVWNAIRGMISWERNKLGWIKFTDVNTSQDSAYILHDYMTNREALRIKLSDTEWYIIENRQKISKHDAAGDRGVYIYHLNNKKWGLPRVEVKCADGFWDFAIDTSTQKLRRLRPNVNGKSEMNFSKRAIKKSYSCFDEVYGNNDAWGDNTDSFDQTYNNVLSPVSNPSSANRINLPFVIEVAEQSNGVFKIQFYFNEIYNGSPSKPQNINLTIDSLNNTLLTWASNKEPDIARYHVYRKISETDDWKLVDVVFHRKDVKLIRWVDEFSLSIKSDQLYYSISTVDLEVNESVKGDICLIEFDEETKEPIITNYAYK